MVDATVPLLLSSECPEGRSIRRGKLSGFRSSIVSEVLTVPAENEFITRLTVNHRSCHDNGVITLIVEPDAGTELIMTGR
ncbi:MULTISPECIES: hypothetical protein [unclassified Pantoea]|uniref:hypothetical protein n=1 Tax=unclassified Pantoea TaxID=2630326 RepID=UPI00301B7EE9